MRSVKKRITLRTSPRENDHGFYILDTALSRSARPLHQMYWPPRPRGCTHLCQNQQVGYTPCSTVHWQVAGAICIFFACYKLPTAKRSQRCVFDFCQLHFYSSISNAFLRALYGLAARFTGLGPPGPLSPGVWFGLADAPEPIGQRKWQELPTQPYGVLPQRAHTTGIGQAFEFRLRMFGLRTWVCNPCEHKLAEIRRARRELRFKLPRRNLIHAGALLGVSE